MPFSDQYYLKRHNMKYHNNKVSTMETPCTETYQNGESGNAQTVKEDYTEKLRNLEINQQRNKDFIQENTMNLFKSLKSQRSWRVVLKHVKNIKLRKSRLKCMIVRYAIGYSRTQTA